MISSHCQARNGAYGAPYAAFPPEPSVGCAVRTKSFTFVHGYCANISICGIAFNAQIVSDPRTITVLWKASRKSGKKQVASAGAMKKAAPTIPLLILLRTFAHLRVTEFDQNNCKNHEKDRDDNNQVEKKLLHGKILTGSKKQSCTEAPVFLTPQLKLYTAEHSLTAVVEIDSPFKFSPSISATVQWITSIGIRCHCPP
jgi:hypothetical protein